MARPLNARLSALCALLLLAPYSNAQNLASLVNGYSPAADSTTSTADVTTTADVTDTLTTSTVNATLTSTSANATVTDVPVNGTAVTNATTTSLVATTSGGVVIEPTSITLPLDTTYPFSSFPVPTASAIPGTFPAADPRRPPRIDSGVIPNFSGAWAEAHKKAQRTLKSWKLEEKVAITTGVGWMGGLCVGNIPAVGKSFPGLCLEDGPLGVRNTDFVSAFPAGINAATTWNRTLFRQRGEAMGAEFKGKGVHVGLGPMMNLGRVAQGGRNWEGFGGDPFLQGEAAFETILGMQQEGTQACAKHYINNEQEFKRTQSSSVVDDRTVHEIYLHPFLRSVQAGAASVMCSYNQLNSTWACEDDRMQNEVLKFELGFQGYVMSDWGAHHSTLAAVAGLDMSMPGDISFSSGTTWWGANLTAFVQNGTIAESRVNDMAERILASWYFLDQDKKYPEVSFNAFNLNDAAVNKHVDVQADHARVVREIGKASSVLLKNTNGALPLKAPKKIAVIGNDAGPSSRGPNGYGDRAGVDGVLAMGWGSGTAEFPYLVTPLEAIQARALEDRANVNWFLNNFDTNSAANIATAAGGNDVALVFVNADSGEEYLTVDGNRGDRKNLTLWQNADNLVLAVAGVNKNTVVIAHSVGPSIIEPWIDHPNVTAVIWAGLPGQEAGNAIVDVLYGDFNPSGRLPYTIAKRVEDYGAQLIVGGGDADTIRITYDDKLNIDYRHFDANNIEPRFPFGFGLSYTTFGYSGLHVKALRHSDRTSADLEAAWAAGKPSPHVAGGSVAIWLHRPAFEVSFRVKNTGKVKGGEIPQLYLHFPASAGEPPSVLRGFSDVLLRPGQEKTVTITLSRYDLSIWNAEAQGWQKPAGQFKFSVGASSRDFKLKGDIPL